MSQLVLASASPQRKELLENLGVEFTVSPSALDESLCKETEPEARVKTLAKMKARAVAQEHPDAFIIGSDTLVVSAEGELLEKPADASDAKMMLGKLSGKTCTVHSSLCVIAPDGSIHEGINSTAVTFKGLSVDEIKWWIQTGLWKDRSGSFQIDGKGQIMIEKIEGDWSGVVGLPVYLLNALLKKAGYNLWLF